MAVDAGQNAVRAQIRQFACSTCSRTRSCGSGGSPPPEPHERLSGRIAVLSAWPAVAIHLDLMPSALISRNLQRDGPHQPYPQPPTGPPGPG